MSRLPKREDELEEIVVYGGRQSIPSHMLGWSEPGGYPDPGIDPSEDPEELSPKEQAKREIWDELIRDGVLSPEARQLMRDHNIQLSEIFRPGIYQMEFDVVLGVEHRQWVRINTDGTSELLTGRPDGNGNLVVSIVPFEQDSHGSGPGGVPYGDLRIYPTADTSEAVRDIAWNAMVSAANLINSRDLHYNLFLQNSNSVFNTLGLAGGLDDFDSGFALGQGRNLFEVDPDNQPPRLSTGDHSQVSGSGGNDIIIGSGSPSEISGGDGADQITGGSVYDIIEGGSGNDTITVIGGIFGGGLGDDTINSSGANEGVVGFGDEGADNVTGSSHADSIDGGDGDDIVIGGAGDDQLFGWTGDDELTGGLGADRMMGEAGADTLDGGDGDDMMSGGEGADSLNGGAGNDIIFGADNGDPLSGMPETSGDWIDGGAGDDTLFGGLNADTIYGGDGADRIRGGGRGDQLWGGAGADTFVFGSAESVDPSVNPTSYLGVDVIHDFVTGVDKLDFRELDIALWSPTRIDDIHWWSAGGSMFVAWDSMGMGANDPNRSHTTLIELVGVTSLSMSDFLLPNVDLVLQGGNFADNLRGMDGNDVIRGRGGADILNGGAGRDTADYSLATSAVTASLVTNVASNDGSGSTDTFISIENLSGSAYNDVLIGNTGDNVLQGRGGSDTLDGGAGIDTADYSQAAAGVTARVDTNVASNDGDGSSDVLISIENLIGSAFNDLLIGNSGVNVLSGGTGGDTLLGFGGNDTLIGGSGTANQLQGGAGDDTYVVEANDTIVEIAGEGTDTVQTTRTTYTLASNVENLIYTGTAAFTATGNASANTISGGGAADVLTGGAGDDTLTGGKGNDTLAGGDGSDTIVLTGLQADYTFATVTGGVQVTDGQLSRDGVDTLTGVEYVRFGNGSTVALSTLLGTPAPVLSAKDLDDAFVLPSGAEWSGVSAHPDLDGAGIGVGLSARVEHFALAERVSEFSHLFSSFTDAGALDVGEHHDWYV